jgi:NAD(P)-dependent dehydrogenase (short-subunit alcohol dehydrogenase family)
MSFEGKIAVVTGGASGIGRATVARLAAAGAEVVAVDIAEGPGVEKCDVTDEASVDGAIASVLERFGRLDLAVNAAGISGHSSLLGDMTTDEWQRMVAVNLTGVFFCLRAELRAMTAGGAGSIVSVSSAGGIGGVPTLSHYSAAKFGVLGLTKSAALEYVGLGIRVNAVCPGPIRTPMLRAWTGSEEAFEALGRTTPMARLGEPEEIAAGIVWLLSDDSSYVTGLGLEIDGGGAAGH